LFPAVISELAIVAERGVGAFRGEGLDGEDLNGFILALSKKQNL
jgi:hypothetical protein